MFILSCALLFAAPPAADPTAVEFDFRSVPQSLPDGPGFGASISVVVGTANGVCSWNQIGFWHGNGPQTRSTYDDIDITEDLAKLMRKLGLDAKALDDKNTIRVGGWPTKTGRQRAVVYGQVYTRGLLSHQLPNVKNPPPAPVVFDCSQLPVAPGRELSITFQVASPDGGDWHRERISYDRLAKRSDLAADLAGRFTKAGLKAEAGGATVRVHGWPRKGGKLLPAARGGASAPGLKPAELPKVKGWPLAPCVVFDFAPIRRDPGRPIKMTFEVATGEGGEAFKEQVVYDRLFELKELADRLLKKNFYAELNGEEVRVYGWVTPQGKLIPPTGGTVEARDAKPEELPKVKNPPNA